MKTFLSQLRDPKYIGQEGMREQAAFTIETLMAERDSARARLVRARKALEVALAYLDNSDSPGGCNGKHPECGHCAAIANVRSALTDDLGTSK